MEKEQNLYFNRLKESVKLLALPYVVQKDFFEDFVDAPFEVLDTFHNAFLHLPKLVEENMLTNLATANVLRLNNLISFTSSNLELKDLDEFQFSHANEWNIVRDLASETIKLLGDKVESPNPKYL